MRCFAISLLAFAIASSTPAQPQADSSHASALSAAVSDGPHPIREQFGSEDAIGISVYDSPELTRTVRVDADGDIRLPMVKQHIHASGLTPDELESAIAAALVDEKVLVAPIVSVTLVESHSKPITIIGAVRNPVTLQVAGTMTLLEAIVKAGGLSDNAGTEIEISRPTPGVNDTQALLTERIPVRSLMDGSDPAANIKLEGGENIRVLQGGRIFIVGNVKRPGPLQITEGSDNSVLKAITLAGGLDSFSSSKAYIYRVEPGNASTNRIPIEIKKIMVFKAPDVPLYGNDMLYVPSATGQRISVKALGMTMGIGLAIAGLLLYLVH
jgi:polysaccharide export outer membrane protein